MRDYAGADDDRPSRGVAPPQELSFIHEEEDAWAVVPRGSPRAGRRRRRRQLADDGTLCVRCGGVGVQRDQRPLDAESGGGGADPDANQVRAHGEDQEPQVIRKQQGFDSLHFRGDAQRSFFATAFCNERDTFFLGTPDREGGRRASRRHHSRARGAHASRLGPAREGRSVGSHSRARLDGASRTRASRSRLGERRPRGARARGGVGDVSGRALRGPRRVEAPQRSAQGRAHPAQRPRQGHQLPRPRHVRHVRGRDRGARPPGATNGDAHRRGSTSRRTPRPAATIFGWRARFASPPTRSSCESATGSGARASATSRTWTWATRGWTRPGRCPSARSSSRSTRRSGPASARSRRRATTEGGDDKKTTRGSLASVLSFIAALAVALHSSRAHFELSPTPRKNALLTAP